jgi:predicted RNA binding protein YcfA (HicA-like mRNA interferase family)
MSRLPQVTPRQMLAALARPVLKTRRVKRSHHYLVHNDEPNRRTTTVAVHPGDLPLRHDILTQAKISRDEFLRLL